MEPESLQLLFESAKNGNKDAQDRIYLSYFNPVFRYIFIRLRNQQDAEDLAQAVFLKFYQSLPRFSYQKDPLAYFFTIARNTVIDHIRKKKTEPIDYAENIPATPPISPQTRHDIVLLLNMLDEKHRDILILKFINGYRTEEIAQILQTSVDNVRQMQCRALKELRNHYEK